jgi:hypothetical protein
LICRAWGLVKRMSCPFGCVPDRWLSDAEFARLAATSEEIAGSLMLTTPDGPQAVADSFRTLRFFDGLERAENDPIVAAEFERLAEHTRALRAIHHGQCMGVAPGDAGSWTRVGAPPLKRDV